MLNSYQEIERIKVIILQTKTGQKLIPRTCQLFWLMALYIFERGHET